MSKLKYYVYELWNPITNLPFYVGKGATDSKNQRTRFPRHLRDAKNAIKNNKKDNNYKINTIISIIESNNLPIFKLVYETSDNKEALDKEIELIKFYGRKDVATGILTNHTDGGEGSTGYKFSQERKNKIKQDFLLKKRKKASKPIYQISIDTGEIINTFESATDACRILNLNTRQEINSCCKDKTRTYSGYYWRRLDDSDDIIDNKLQNFAELNIWRKSGKSSKAINQIDEFGNIIKIWNSTADVDRFFNLKSRTIRSAMEKNKKCQGYYWKYTDSE